MTVRASTDRPEIVIACCRALGRVGGQASVEALVSVLEKRRLFVFGPRWEEPVRVAAAAVLREIDHPAGAAALASLRDDPHPGVREIARAALEETPATAADPEDEPPGEPAPATA